MQRLGWRLCLGLLVGIGFAPYAFAQTAFTWPEIRAKFEAVNLTLPGVLL